MNIDQLNLEIEKHKATLYEILDTLVAFDTQSPPARNTEAAQQYVIDFLRKLNFETESKELYPGDILVWGKKKGRLADRFQSLILNGHMDVATVGNKEEWLTDPFKLIEKNGYLYGRGVSDMKAGLAANLFVLYLFDLLKLELKGDIEFQSVVGEEAGEAGTRTLLEMGNTADFAIVSDTSNCMLQGQGGCITGWIILKSKEQFHDGNRQKIVHSGGGVKGAGMIDKMAVLIRGLNELERDWGITKSYPGFPAGSNTINPSYIEGGIHPAFVANECKLWITVHFYPNENVADIIQEVEAHILAVAKSDVWMRDNLPVFEWGGRSMLEDKGEIFPSLELDENSAALQLLQKNHQAIFQQEAKVNMSPTVNDSGWFDYFKIPAVSYGPGELIEAHSVNERLLKDEFEKYTKTIAAFVYQWCNQEKD